MALDIIKKTGDSLSADEFNEVVSAINGKVDKENGKGLSSNDYKTQDKNKLAGLSNYNDTTLKSRLNTVESRLDSITGSVISLTEIEAGKLLYAGKEYTVYKLTAELSGLPTEANSSTDILLSEQPCGDNLYLAVDCLSVSTDSGFATSAYELKKIFVDGQMNTKATIVCKENMSGLSKVLLTISYIKGLLSFDVFEISLPVSELGISSASEVTIEIPPLKYDKKFAFSWTTDDSILGVYSLLHKYINKKYIDDTYNFHDGMPPTTGFTPTRVLCSTDGCGNDVRFRVDSGWVSYNNNISDGIHSDSYPYRYVRWTELTTFLDFFNTVMNHGGGDQTKPLESIEMNANRLIEKVGYNPFLLLVPGGTTGYQETAGSLEYIYHYHNKENLNYSVDNLTKTSFASKSGLLGRKTYDGMTYEQLCSYVDTQAVRIDHPYVYLGGHVVGDTDEQIKWTDAVKPFLDYLYDTYGKGGNDSIWFAGPEEVYEYLFVRAYSLVSKSVINGNIVIKVKVARLPLFKKLEFSILVRKTGGFSTVSQLSVNKMVMKTACALKEGNLLININYNPQLLELAEKYTSKYEASQRDEDKEDALYFTNMLNEDLKEPFITRINAGETAPILNSISINSGAASTYDSNVAVTLNVIGKITHYKISENQDLTSVSWIEGTSKSLAFNLSSGTYGLKNIYVQVKNTYGESEIKGDSIEYLEKPSVIYIVTARANNSAYGSVTPASQTVSPGSSVEITANANSGYVIESWSGADNSTGIGQSQGTARVTNIQSDKTVICNFKPEGSTPPAGTMKIILFPTASDIGIITLPSGEKATRVRVPFSTSFPVTSIVDTQGNTVGEKISDKSNLPVDISDMARSSNTDPTLEGNLGIYPDEYINTMYGVYGSGVYPAQRGLVRLTGLPAGTYNIRILYSTIKALTSEQTLGIIYEANGITANPPSGFTAVNNVNQFIELNNVIVGSNGVLDIYMGNTSPYVRTGFNAIELNKL